MEAGGGNASTSPGPPGRARHVGEIVLLALVALSGIGIAVNDYSPRAGYHYWLAMVPAFGAVSLWAAWARAQRVGESVGAVLGTQLLHWLGAVGAVYLIYLLESTGRMTNEAAGGGALIVLALASFLSGVHSDWRLCAVGAILGVTAAAFAILEEVLWMVLLPVLVVAAVAVWLYVRRANATA